MAVIHSKKCKVCNSAFRDRIETLSIKGMNPQKIYMYLQSLQDPEEQEIVKLEGINPSSIRRHIDNHFKKEEAVQIKLSETHDRVEKSRQNLQNGVTIAIDKINSLCHMIDVTLIKMEEVDNDESLNNKSKYSFTISFMNTAKGLIESLAKLTGDLKQEGTIDVNYFSNEIGTFADLVLATIRSIDKKLQLNGTLETEFAQEFKTEWDNYKQKQVAVINGELPIPKQNIQNTFNDGV